MMSVWMVYAVAITGITYLAAAAVEHLLWIWRAPRRAAWIVALVVGTTAPLLTPSWRGAPPSSNPAPALIRTEPPSITMWAAGSVTPLQGTPAVRPATIEAVSTLRLESVLPVIWLGTSGLLLLLALISYARLERESAAWPEVNIDGTRVLISSDRGPAVFGLWRQFIVLPRWALSLDVEARTLMLYHEREHLRANDPRCLLIAMFAALLFPWNVALWFVVRRLRLAIELDCDDRVLRRHADTRVYGSLLLTVGARRANEMPFAVALVERSSMLERRIRSMTATTPSRRFLASIPLLLSVVVLSAAAARTPAPRPLSLGHHSAAAAKQPTSGTATPRALPRLATAESLPLISATWENAPIDDVIAAFAAFSHRSITIAADVGGVVTATVVGQPWRQALETIMERQGLRVEFRSDSSVYISTRRSSEPHSRESLGASTARTVTGVVDNAETGAPLADAYINVAGTQLIGAPNEAWTDARGRFSLRVLDGEVWLDASAPGYEFTRVTLGPKDSIAIFHARSTGECPSSDTTTGPTAPRRRQIRDLVYGPAIVVGGQVLSGPTPPPAVCPPRGSHSGQVQFRIF